MFGKFEQFLPDAVFQEAVMRANDDEVWGSRAANLCHEWRHGSYQNPLAFGGRGIT